MSRILALDHGSSRCGVALSDPTGSIASPLEAVQKPDTKAGYRAIVDICERNEVTKVVVGLPISLSGNETDQTDAAKAFASQLERRLQGRAEVVLIDERLTTSEARRVGGSSDEDSRAAAVLLERWLAIQEER